MEPTDHGIILRIVEIGLPIISAVITTILSLLAVFIKGMLRQQNETGKMQSQKLEKIYTSISILAEAAQSHDRNVLRLDKLMHEDIIKAKEDHGQILAILFFSLGLDDKNENSMEVLKSFLHKVAPTKDTDSLA